MNPEQARWFSENFANLVGNVERVIMGKTEAIRLAVTCMFAEGHLLLEDYPGTGKTTLARAIAQSVQGTHSRIQFTPDLLPSDVTGVTIYDQRSGEFEFHQGPIFAAIVLADEINRASPKTQSALLEVMEESRVTVDGQSYSVGNPFMVIATQNPIEMEGTYPLPEAQRDRFMARIQMGYPGKESEAKMLLAQAGGDQLAKVQPITNVEAIQRAATALQAVYVAPLIADYIVDITAATREHADLRLGNSPRAALHLMEVARVEAALAGRDYVIPEDVQALAVEVLAHRVITTVEAQVAARESAEVIEGIVRQVPAPSRG